MPSAPIPHISFSRDEMLMRLGDKDYEFVPASPAHPNCAVCDMDVDSMFCNIPMMMPRKCSADTRADGLRGYWRCV